MFNVSTSCNISVISELVQMCISMSRSTILLLFSARSLRLVIQNLEYSSFKYSLIHSMMMLENWCDVSWNCLIVFEYSPVYFPSFDFWDTSFFSRYYSYPCATESKNCLYHCLWFLCLVQTNSGGLDFLMFAVSWVRFHTSQFATEQTETWKSRQNVGRWACTMYLVPC